MAKLTDLSDLGKLLGAEPSQSASEAATTVKDRATSMVTLDIRMETKGRKGKGVTVIRGFFHTADDLEALAKKLKAACGAGGTVKDDCIEIQGDHRQKVAGMLQKEGFKVKVIKSGK
jgi:translation initiation factor 1